LRKKIVAKSARSGPVSTCPTVVGAPTAPLVSVSRLLDRASPALEKALSICCWDNPNGPLISQFWISSS
jgi:hypothetical protein